MRKKHEFIAREVADQTVIVPTGRLVVDFNCLITLNKTGRWLWDRLDQSESAEALAEEMANEFEVDPGTARKDVEEFLAELVSAGIVDQ